MSDAAATEAHLGDEADEENEADRKIATK